MLHKPLPSALVSGRAVIPPGPTSWDLAELGSGAYETNPQYEVSRDQKKIVAQINILKGVFEQKRTVCGERRKQDSLQVIFIRGISSWSISHDL